MEKYTRGGGFVNWKANSTKKVLGTYLIKGKNIDLVAPIVFFEREDDEKYSLNPSDEYKNIFRSIKVKSTALNSIDKGYSVKGELDNGTKVTIKRILSTFEDGGALIGNQSKIDMNDNNKIDAEDFVILRKSMNGAWRNEHKHVNSTSRKEGKVIQYEIRYARKKNPSRKGYRGKQNFENGGYTDLSKEKANVINESNLKDTELVPEIDIEYIKKINLKLTDNKIRSEDDAVKVFKELFDKNSINAYEEVKVLFLDNTNVVIGVYSHSKGGIAGTIVDVEMICALAVKCLARGVIMCHNHPSGSLKFSDADKTTSRNLKNALNLFQIVLMDSIVITNNGYISMKSEGIFLRGGTVKLNTGGNVTFKRKAKSIAKKFEGQKVEPKYQQEYGKRYDKAEAQEVGNKIAGKMKAMGMEKKAFGGFFGKSAIKTKSHLSLDEKQVMLKNGDWVQVLDHSGDTLLVMDLNKLGSGAQPKKVSITEVDESSYNI